MASELENFRTLLIAQNGSRSNITQIYNDCDNEIKQKYPNLLPQLSAHMTSPQTSAISSARLTPSPSPSTSLRVDKTRQDEAKHGSLQSSARLKSATTPATTPVGSVISIKDKNGSEPTFELVKNTRNVQFAIDKSSGSALKAPAAAAAAAETSYFGNVYDSQKYKTLDQQQQQTQSEAAASITKFELKSQVTAEKNPDSGIYKTAPLKLQQQQPRQQLAQQQQQQLQSQSVLGSVSGSVSRSVNPQSVNQQLEHHRGAEDVMHPQSVDQQSAARPAESARPASPMPLEQVRAPSSIPTTQVVAQSVTQEKQNQQLQPQPQDRASDSPPTSPPTSHLFFGLFIAMLFALEVFFWYSAIKAYNYDLNKNPSMYSNIKNIGIGLFTLNALFIPLYIMLLNYYYMVYNHKKYKNQYFAALLCCIALIYGIKIALLTLDSRIIKIFD